MNQTYLLLGSNEGNRTQWFDTAMEQLATHGTVGRRSSIYETAAWGIEEQPDFLNMVIEFNTDLSPVELLTAIHTIEIACGRQREVKWGQRTLDIDILLYNNDRIEVPGLVVPHPFLHLRRFTLIPLAELVPGLVHPILNRTIAQLLQDCPDPLEVHRYIAP